MINWKLRLKSKMFWVSLISSVILLLQTIVVPMGIKLDFGDVGNVLLGILDAAFGVLAVLGIVVDPTTDGVSDSELALTYEEPRKENENE